MSFSRKIMPFVCLNSRIPKGCRTDSSQMSNVICVLTYRSYKYTCTCHFTRPRFGWKRESRGRSPKARGVPSVALPPLQPPSSSFRSHVLTGSSARETASVSELPRPPESHGWRASRAGEIALRRSDRTAVFWICGYHCYWQQYFVAAFCLAGFLGLCCLFYEWR